MPPHTRKLRVKPAAARSLQRALSILLLIAILLVIANGALAFHEEQVLAEREFWVTHTLEVIDDLEHAIGSVKDAETGERGYLITGREEFLLPFERAQTSIVPEFDHLIAETADNPPQSARLRAIKAVAVGRLGLLAAAVELRRKQGEAAGFALVRQGNGNAEMENLRHAVAGAQAVEHDLLEQRLHDSTNARAEARLAVAIASGMDVFLLILALGWLDYERRRRREANEIASRLEKLQAISDVALTSLSLPALTDELLGRLLRLAEVDAVTLLRRVGGAMEATASAGFHLTPGRRIAVDGAGPLARCTREARMGRLDDLQASELELPEISEGMRSVLIVPMVLEGEVLGLVVAARTEAFAFQPADEELLSLVGDRVAAAMHRTTLFEREAEARRAAEAASAEVSLLNGELEERVRQRTQELESTNRELEAFSYSVSHDLRAPLRTVDGFSVALAEDFGPVLNDEGKHYLARIRNGVQRMGSLIDALLQLSRITRAELAPEPVDLSALAGEVARGIADSAPERSFDWQIEPGLTTEGDSRLLRAVFENMLGNAAKFTAKVPVARIAFGWSPEQGAFFIRDNGAGFDQAYAGKLFVAFQRLHGDKDFAGSGIGLATVARVIRRHHGRIWAEGAVGEGALFWFTLGGRA